MHKRRCACRNDGNYKGFANESASSYWNYDSMPRIGLSRGTGAGSGAITMLAAR